jgi:hypothetical protein
MQRLDNPPGIKGPNPILVFDFNGLVGRPQAVARSLFNLLGRIHVQPGTCALLTGNGGFEAILSPGNHTYLSLPAGPLVMQVVDMTVQHRSVPEVSALSRDKWHVTLAGVLSFQIADPFKAANTAHLLETLDTAAKAALLALLEEFDHDALTGKLLDDPTPPPAPRSQGLEAEEGQQSGIKKKGDEVNPTVILPQSGIPALCQGMVEKLGADPSLAPLQIIGFHVTYRAGDERRIEITQVSSVEQTRILEESRVKRLAHQATLLELGAEIEQRQQEQKLRQLELAQERESAQNAELIRLMQSETESKMAYLMRAEREFQAQQKRMEEEWKVAREFDLLQLKSRHEEAVAAIQGTTIVSAEAAANGQLGANLNLSPRRRAEILAAEPALSQTNNDIISQGLQALKDLPSATNAYTFFLPNHLQSGTGRHSQTEGGGQTNLNHKEGAGSSGSGGGGDKNGTGEEGKPAEDKQTAKTGEGAGQESGEGAGGENGARS